MTAKCSTLMPSCAHGPNGPHKLPLLAFLALVLLHTPTSAEQTSTYNFVANQSTITQTGGIAGINRTYTVTGTYCLAVDIKAATAAFKRVDANAVDDSSDRNTLDPNEVFDLTGLSGAILDETTIQFEGTTPDGSSVNINLTFADDTIALKGQSTPPPNSADFFTFTLDALAKRKYSGGTGGPNNPYQLATAADLITLGETPKDYDKHFILTADIDLDPSLPGRKIFDKAVIAPHLNPFDSWPFEGTPFAGVLSGNGHRISHLTITGGDYLGLVGQLDSQAVVSNLALEEVDIYGTGICVGGLAGCIEEGGITSSYSTGVIDGYWGVGGLVGWNWGGSISTTYSNGTVGGDEHIGGLVGWNWLGTITNSYSSGQTSGTGWHIGGLVGKDFGGLIDTSFWGIQTSGRATSDGGLGKTTSEMQTAVTFLEAGWDFVGETANGTEDIWWILEGRDYPRLWWQLPGDDFEDGESLPLWQVYEQDEENSWMEETNGRLEARATSRAAATFAGYVSHGWLLDTARDFALKVKFHYGKISFGDSWVLIGLAPSLAEPISQHVVLEAGCIEDQPFYLCEAIDGSWRQEREVFRPSNDGTLYISYEADTDKLHVSYTGYGETNAWHSFNGLLRDRWAAQSVHVVLGCGSEKVELKSDDAYLNDFVVDDGTIRQPDL